VQPPLVAPVLGQRLEVGLPAPGAVTGRRHLDRWVKGAEQPLRFAVQTDPLRPPANRVAK
jgi:hypothetical protein